MAVEHAAMKAEDEFFGALLRGDGTALEAVLSPDFLLIDVCRDLRSRATFSWRSLVRGSCASNRSNA